MTITLPKLVKVTWENGDVTFEIPLSITDDRLIYQLDPKLHGNYWAYVSMSTPVDPAAEAPEIRIGQIFTVEGKKYVIVQPRSDQQLADSNDHGHLVLTIIDI
jgi:hypothetical protein